MASPLSSPDLHRNQAAGKPVSASHLASTLGDSMSRPQSTFNRFDEIDIPPYELSDNMISILEKPLGPAAQRAYAVSLGGRQTQSYAGPQDGFRINVTAPTGTAVSQTGALVGGKSGAKHEEYGFCMNQNWRYTSKVSRPRHGRHDIAMLMSAFSMIPRPKKQRNCSRRIISS